MTNKCTIISQIITLLHVSTLSCHPQGACNLYFASYTSISNAAVGNRFTIKMFHVGFMQVINRITNSCIWITCVTWQGIDYKLLEDDTIVSKHIGVW